MIAAALVAVWLAVGNSSFDLAAFGRAFTEIHWGWFSAALVVVFLTFVGRAWRWVVMVRPMSDSIRLGPVLRDTLIGLSATVAIGRAGEFVRPVLIARAHGLTVSSQLAIWFLERLTDLLSVLILFGFALAYIPGDVFRQAGPELAWVLTNGGRLAVVIGLISLAVLLLFRWAPALSERRMGEALSALPEPARRKAGELTHAFVSGLAATRDVRALLAIIGLSFLEWALIAASYKLLFQSFGPTAGLSWRDTLIVLGFVSFGSVIQIPGIGGGVQIVTLLVLEQLFGVAREPASAIALLLWLIGFAAMAPIGVILGLRRGWSLARLRQLGKEGG